MNTAMTGHPIVDAIAQLNIEGNIIPHSWYRHIRYSNKRGTYTDSLACLILADLLYWYRPVEERDELTGELTGWRKKFADDNLRRSPSAWAEMFGVTVKQVRESIHLLENLELVDVELKPYQTNFGTIPNVMFISLNPEAVRKITYRIIAKPEVPEKSLLPKSATSKSMLPKSETRQAGTTEKSLSPKSETKESLLPKSEQLVPKSVTSHAEISNSSLYRDFNRDLVETTILPPNPPSDFKPGKGASPEVVEVEAEVLPPDSPSSQSQPSHPPSQQEPKAPGQDNCSATYRANENSYHSKQALFPKNLDGSDRLPWDTDKARVFDPEFEKHMARSLMQYPAYRDLMAGELMTKIRKHISAGRYDMKRRDELLIEWEAMHSRGSTGDMAYGITAKAASRRALIRSALSS